MTTSNLLNRILLSSSQQNERPHTWHPDAKLMNDLGSRAEVAAGVETVSRLSDRQTSLIFYVPNALSVQVFLDRLSSG